MKKIKQILFAALFAITSLVNIAGAQNIGGGIYAAGGSTLTLPTTLTSTTGQGLTLDCATATTALKCLYIKQAFNAVGVSFTPFVLEYTGGATAAAGTNLFDVTLDAAHMLVLTKAGALTSAAGMSATGWTTANSGTAASNLSFFATGNTGVYFGVDNSAGNGFMSGGSAYSAVMMTVANRSLVLGTNGAARFSIDGNGVTQIAGGTLQLNSNANLSQTGASTIACGNGTPGNATCTLQLATLTASATISTGGYTVALLPAAGTAGRRAYITDQLTTCAVTGAAVTGGGAVKCPVFDNGVAWVGG